MTSPQMTPQQLFELLTKELSASGSVAIPSPDGGNLTLRQAVGEIYAKARGWLKLAPDRPRAPKEFDDLYGHILNLRAEHLITQAILADLAARLGTDVKTIRDNVIGSLA